LSIRPRIRHPLCGWSPRKDDQPEATAGDMQCPEGTIFHCLEHGDKEHIIMIENFRICAGCVDAPGANSPSTLLEEIVCQR
jgi:hypothetical protein